MTTSPAASRPGDLTERIIVAGVGALFLFILAVVGFNVIDSWLPGFIVLVLIPVHVVLAITDTNILEDPKRAPARAFAELKRLVPSTPAGPHGGPTSGATPFGGPAPGPAQFGPPPSGQAQFGGPAPSPAQFGGPSSGPAQFGGPPSGPAQFGGPAPGVAPFGPPPPGPQFGGPPSGPAQFGGPPSGPAQFGGPPATGYMPPSGPVALWSGHSYDPPGPHGPSVVHGFGSYGNRDTAQPTEPAPTPAQPVEPAPTAAQPVEPTTNHQVQDSESSDATSTSSAIMPPAAQWDQPDGDGDVDDPDMTIQRPPRDS